MFKLLGQYDNAKEYYQKALVITIEIGDKNGEAADYLNLGIVYKSFGQYDKAKLYLQKARVIKTEIGDREGETAVYGNLGILFDLLRQHDKAVKYFQVLVLELKLVISKGRQ